MRQRDDRVRATANGYLEHWDDTTRAVLSFRTVFSADMTPTNQMSTGIAYLGPGDWLGVHRHTATEIYPILNGAGIVTLDGTEHTVRAGDTVFIGSDAEHGIRNNGTDELRFHYTVNVASFSDVHYRSPDEHAVVDGGGSAVGVIDEVRCLAPAWWGQTPRGTHIRRLGRSWPGVGLR